MPQNQALRLRSSSLLSALVFVAAQGCSGRWSSSCSQFAEGGGGGELNASGGLPSESHHGLEHGPDGLLEPSHNRITDISPLITLTGIRTLHLAGNQIANISPLSALLALQVLSIQTNPISDLTPLVSNSGIGPGELHSRHRKPSYRLHSPGDCAAALTRRDFHDCP